MHNAVDLESDMVRTVQALSEAAEFLRRYDRVQAALRQEADGGGRAPLTARVEEGLAAAHRVLAAVRAPARDGDGEPRIPAQRRAPGRHGDPGE